MSNQEPDVEDSATNEVPAKHSRHHSPVPGIVRRMMVVRFDGSVIKMGSDEHPREVSNSDETGYRTVSLCSNTTMGTRTISDP